MYMATDMHSRLTLYYLDDVLYSTVGVSLYLTLDPDQWLDLSGQTIGHQFKVAIWRDKGNGAVVLESREADTLVEFHVF